MGVRKTKHEGGLIGGHINIPAFRSSGSITRLHSGGGAVAGGGSTRGGVPSGGGINIYAFTDLKALTKHMASRDGQKIIFDTVKGRRIDLGIS
jgi:hypothetical protein